MLKTLKSRVSDGAFLLDQINPGWYKKINLGTLSLSSCGSCVLGQLMGGYWKAIDNDQKYINNAFEEIYKGNNPKFNDIETYKLGFAINYSNTKERDFPNIYEVLTDLWKNEISLRLQLNIESQDRIEKREIINV